MEITFDPVKREVTLKERGLDFVDAKTLFEGVTLEFEDDRFDYGEVRMISVGMLLAAIVVVVWADEGDARRVISMRKATKGETDEYFRAVG
ncbi:MAG: BrnT family toxin [Alphaproteobacteria bacterium]|nr:MAG: BrnT family toxin [Alphaproteobacteria bacterium]